MMAGRDAMPRMMMGGRMGGMGMSVSEMFLAHTGDLQLTDAQVTKLAAIARRVDARQKAMRARMDSSMRAMHERVEVSRDGGPPMAGAMMMRMAMPSDADRKAQHEDDREAFSVVTPDQMATAWEMMMMMHHRH